MNDVKQKALGIVGSLAQKAAKAAKDEVKKTAKATVQQTGFENSSEGNQQAAQAVDSQQQDAKRAQTEQVVKSLYGIDSGKVADSDNPQAKVALKIAEKQPDISPEDLQKQAALRMQLHQAYVDATFDKPKPQEPTVQEEHEREEQQKMVDLQEKKKKEPPPIAVRMSTNKTEQFPGTSG